MKPKSKEEFISSLKPIIEKLLESIGEDTKREGLKETPRRVAEMYQEILKGYSESETPKVTVFNNDQKYDEMIVDEGYFYSLCEHHMIPFFGKVFIAYIPNKKIIGISKLARIVDHFSAKLQVQERLTQQIALYIEEILKPRGIAVFLYARHLCREMRGVKKFNSFMTTTELLGLFKDDARTRVEFLGLVHSKINNEK